MTEKQVSEAVLNRRRVAVVTFKSYADRAVGKVGKALSVLRALECEMGDGKCPTVQVWLPRDISSVEQAAVIAPCKFTPGQVLVVEYDALYKSTFALNGWRMDAAAVSPLQK